MSQRKDETIAEVRAARQKISEKFGHDPQLLIEHYMELQKQYQDRLLPLQRVEHGNGDYTEDRHEWLPNGSVREVVAKLEKNAELQAKA